MTLLFVLSSTQATDWWSIATSWTQPQPLDPQAQSDSGRSYIHDTVWLSPFGTQTFSLLLLDILTPEFSGTLDFSGLFQKIPENSRLHAYLWTCVMNAPLWP